MIITQDELMTLKELLEDANDMAGGYLNSNTPEGHLELTERFPSILRAESLLQRADVRDDAYLADDDNWRSLFISHRGTVLVIPSICAVGPITELRRIAGEAPAYGITVYYTNGYQQIAFTEKEGGEAEIQRCRTRLLARIERYYLNKHGKGGHEIKCHKSFTE